MIIFKYSNSTCIVDLFCSDQVFRTVVTNFAKWCSFYCMSYVWLQSQQTSFGAVKVIQS